MQTVSLATMSPQSPKMLLILVSILGLLLLNLVAGVSGEANDDVSSPDCSTHRTCSDCLDSADTNCGWCLLENKCSAVSDCPEIPNTLLQWFTKLQGKCPVIKTVTPDKATRTTRTSLSLVLKEFPELTGRFSCAFTISDQTIITDAVRSGNTITCDTPESDVLPVISEEQRRNNQYHYTVKLSVRRTIGPDLVSTDFTFFDCSVISSCKTCVTTEATLPCDFCVEKNVCTHDAKAECPTDLSASETASHEPALAMPEDFCPNLKQSVPDETSAVVKPEMTLFGSHEPGTKISPDFCPRLDDSESVGARYIPSGTSKAVRTKVILVGQFIIQTRFACEFTIDGNVVRVDARLCADTVYCDETTFSFEYKDSPTQIVPFSIVWGGSKALDNWGDMHFVLYHCNKLAATCADCNALDKRYNCGWCGDTSTCEVRDQCQPPTSTWISNNPRRCDNA